MAAVTKVLVVVVSVMALAWSFPSNMNSFSPEEFSRLIQPYSVPMFPSQVDDFNTDGQGLGSASAVDVDSQGDLFVFHRADRPWTAQTFDYKTNALSEQAREPIGSDVILKLNPMTGRVISGFGANLFNVPHGLKIDKNDNIWVTDVGRHQVLRFTNGSTTPNLELGEKFVPGNDDTHFCQPTDVAIASNGEFFVSDGYCNSRIMKFSADGRLIAKWGAAIGNDGIMTPYHFTIPHSITLAEELDLVCVADRENERVSCFNAGLGSGRQLGAFNRTIIKPGDVGKVFAVYFNKRAGSIEAAAETARAPFSDGVSLIYPPRAFTYTMGGDLVGAWAEITPRMARDGPTLIHDLCVSKDSQDYFLADVAQQRVFKYSTNPNRLRFVV